MKITNSFHKQKEQTPQRGWIVQPLWKCTPVQLVLRQSSFGFVLPFLWRCVLNCHGFFCRSSCVNWCQGEIKSSVKIYTIMQVKLMSSKSAMESKTGGSGVYSYNNWAMCYSFFLNRSLVEKEKCQDHFSLRFKSVSVSHILTLSLYPSSFGSQKERGIGGMARGLLGRRSYKLKNGARSVKKNRSGSDLPPHVTPILTVSRTELLWQCQEALHKRWCLVHSWDLPCVR